MAQGFLTVRHLLLGFVKLINIAFSEVLERSDLIFSIAHEKVIRLYYIVAQGLSHCIGVFEQKERKNENIKQKAKKPKKKKPKKCQAPSNGIEPAPLACLLAPLLPTLFWHLRVRRVRLKYSFFALSTLVCNLRYLTRHHYHTSSPIILE